MKSDMNLDIDFLDMVLSALPSNIFFKDTECRYIFASHYWHHIRHDEYENWSIRGKTDLEIRKDKNNAMLAYEQDKKIIATGQGCSYVIEECTDGKTEYLEIIKNPVRNEKNEIIGIAGIINDITEKVMLKQHLDVYTSVDILTGLYNKKGFFEKLPEELSSCKNSGKTSVMVLISYTKTNISLHDALLIIANIIKVSNIPDKICSRIEYNIFAVLLFCESQEKIKDTINDFISETENKIRVLVGNASDFILPDFLVQWEEIEYSDLDECEKTFCSLKKKLMKKLAEKGNYYEDYKSRLFSLRNEIIDEPEKDWNIPDITKKIGISKSHFHRLYKSLFSVSCSNDIINARLDKACHLLTYTNMRVQEIAMKCGYKNEAHFMRQFRDKIGVTALQFRKQNKENISE